MQTSITQQSNKSKYLITALIWLGLWELVSMLINEEVLFVPPHKVVLTLFHMFGTLSYWQTISYSIVRVMSGFILGYLFSALLAVLAYRFSFVKTFLSPAVSVIKATPVASFIILALIWTGKNMVPLIICILMVTPIVWSNILEGLNAVDKNLLEMGKVYKMSIVDKVKYIYMPSLKPYNVAAVGSSLGLCWKAGIAAEVICRAMPSIGNSIWETKFYIMTDELFAWTATVVILSVIFDKIFHRITGAKKK